MPTPRNTGAAYAPAVAALRSGPDAVVLPFRVRYGGYFSRAFGEVARQFLTHPVTSPPSIDAVRTVHSITSSAVASSDCGIVRPSALAVFRLITSSNLVGCRTGSAPGCSPLRI